MNWWPFGKSETPQQVTQPAAQVADGFVSFEQFAGVELRIGTILEVEPVDGSEKLLKLSVDFGEGTPRQVVSGIAKSFAPGDLRGRQHAFVTNLAPRKMMGIESQAMILAADAEGGLALVAPSRPVPPGSQLH
jgi:methionyl-tRNA synthetase